MAKPTDMISSIRTDGIGGTPQADVRLVSPVFDIADERSGKAEPRDISLEDRFREMVNPTALDAPETSGDDASDDETPVDETPEEPGNVVTSGVDLPTSPSVSHDPATLGDSDASDDETEDGSSPSPEDEGDLHDLKVVELLALAEERGIDVPSGARKDEIIDLLEAKG